MKTKIKRHSRAVISVVLTLCMLVSCMTVGLIATDAARVTGDRIGSAEDWVVIGNVTNSGYWDGTGVTMTSDTGGYEATVYLTNSKDFRIRHNNNDYGASTNQASERTVTTGNQYNVYNNSNTWIWGGSTGNYKIFINSDGSKVYFSSTSDTTPFSGGEGGDPDPSGDLPVTSDNFPMIVTYDGVSEKWDCVYAWQNDDSAKNDAISEMSNPSAPNDALTSVYFKKLTGAYEDNKQIDFILAENTGWTNQSGNVENSSFTKAKQWYAYNRSTDNHNKNNTLSDRNAEYTPLTLNSISHSTGSTYTVGVDDTVTVNAQGGLPWFASTESFSTSAKYRLTVEDDKSSTISNDTTDVTCAVTTGKDISFTWTPSEIGVHTLTYTLTDGIDTVTYSENYNVIYPLTTPTLKIDNKTGSSTVTASTTDTSTITLTNAAGTYPAGTKFTLYKGGSAVTYNTTGNFTVARNSDTAGNYTVVAEPGASDTTHTNSVASSAVTLTVNKVAAPDTPEITVDSATINKGGKVTITVTNYSDYDLSLYDLTLYKYKDNNATLAAASVTGKVGTFSSNTYVNVAEDGSNTYAHYKVVAVAKNQNVYSNSADSDVLNVKVVSPNWYTVGTYNFNTANSSSWSDDTGDGTLVNKYYKDNVFYRIVTLSSTTTEGKFRLIKKSNSWWAGPNSSDVASSTGTISALNYSESEPLQVQWNCDNRYYNVTGYTTYVLFLDQSGDDDDPATAPKIWVRTDMSQVTVTPKYEDFTLSTGVYGSATNADSTKLVCNVDSTIVENGDTITLTANVLDSDYEFAGWFTNAACTGTPASTDLTYTPTVSATTTYYPLVRQKYTLADVYMDKPTNVSTLTATWNGKTAAKGKTLKNVPVGATVNLAATAADGYSVTKLIVTEADGSSTEINSNSGSFTMPAGGATISAEAKPNKYFWYHKGIASGGDANEKVTPVSNTNTGNSTWTYDANIAVDKINGKYVAKIPASYFTGTEYSTFCFSDSSSAVLNQMFYRSSSDSATITVDYGDTTSTNYITAYNHRYKVESSEYNNLTDRNYLYAKVKFDDATYLANAQYVLMEADTNNRKYTFTLVSSDNPVSYQVTAKDGTIRWKDGGTYITYAQYATTEITSIMRAGTEMIEDAGCAYTEHDYQNSDGTEATSASEAELKQKYRTATVHAGDVLTIKTTLEDTNSFRSNYYVKGFVINGQTAKTFTWNSSGEYQMDYTVTGEERNNKIEITPVYFLKDDSNTINFSIDGFEPDLQYNGTTPKWADTLYVYPYYEYNGSSITGADNEFGPYPGQPMVFDGGKYYIQIPKTITRTVSGKSVTCTIQGVTMSNGYWDHVHRQVIGWTTTDDNHCQTYDYDDFYKIAKEHSPDNITFEFKYRDTTANKDVGSGTLASTYTAATFESTFQNGFDDLLDAHNRKIDVLGNILTDSQKNNSPVYVISKGYQVTNAGSYATTWTVYAPDVQTGTPTTWTMQTANSGSLKAINPAALALTASSHFNEYSNTAFKAFKPLYDVLDGNSLVKGHPVKISFEKEIKSGSQVAQRSDGQWYHSKNNDIIQAEIKIAYLSSGGTMLYDTYTVDEDASDVTGTTTGASAYFTNEDTNVAGESFKDLRKTGEVYSNNKEYFTFAAESSENYTFVKWMRRTGTNASNYQYYDIVGDAQSPKTSSDVYVALFRPFTGGRLTVKNTVKTDGSYTGAGTTYVNLEVLNTENATSAYYETGFKKNSASLDSMYIAENSSKWVRVTLKTEPSGFNVFQQFSYKDADDDNTIKTTEVAKYFPSGGVTAGTGYTLSSGVATKTFKLQISDLFGEGGVQNKSVLEYFSELNQVYLRYALTYNFKGREFSDDTHSQSYTVRGIFTTEEYKNYVTVDGTDSTKYHISSTFITNKKPFERDFMRDIIFNYDAAAATAITPSGTEYDKTLALSIDQAEKEGDTDREGIFTLPYCYNANNGYKVNDYVPITNYQHTTSTVGTTTHHYFKEIGYWFSDQDDGWNDYKNEALTWISEGYENCPYNSANDLKFTSALQNGIPKYENPSNSNVPNFTIGTKYGKRFVADFSKYPTGENASDESKYEYIEAAPAVYDENADTSTYPDKIRYFSYWLITNEDGKEIAKCYNNAFNFSAYDEYHIEAIYNNTSMNSNYAAGYSEPLGASVSYLDYSRNQWNENGKGKASYYAGDVLFEDFAVAYKYHSEVFNTYNAEDVRVGVVIERIYNGIEKSNNTAILNMDYYERERAGEVSARVAQIKTNLLAGTMSDKTSSEYGLFIKPVATNVAADRTTWGKDISDPTIIDNKNRLKYHYAVYNSYQSTEASTGVDYTYKNDLYRIYSFIMIRDKDGTWSSDANHMYVTDNPAYFTFYEVARR